MRDFAVPFLLLTVTLWVYLLVTKHFGGFVFLGLFLVSGALAVMLYRVDDVTEAKVDIRQLMFKLDQTKSEVYAKAEAVQRMAEQVGLIAATTVSQLWAFAPRDPSYRRAQERDRLAVMLADAGLSQERVQAALKPLNDRIRSALAFEVARDARLAISKKRPRPTDPKAAAAHDAEMQRLQAELRSLIVSSAAGSAEAAIRPVIESHGAGLDDVRASLTRFEHFRSTGEVSPLPTQPGEIDDAG